MLYEFLLLIGHDKCPQARCKMAALAELLENGVFSRV
jgi:hypothetical protein